jgi:hypothetical protein
MREKKTRMRIPSSLRLGLFFHFLPFTPTERERERWTWVDKGGGHGKGEKGGKNEGEGLLVAFQFGDSSDPSGSVSPRRQYTHLDGPSMRFALNSARQTEHGMRVSTPNSSAYMGERPHTLS